MDKLPPCPFCGSEAIIVDEWLCTCGFKYCDMNASLMSIAAWNTRHTPEGCAELYVGDGKFAYCDWADFDLVKGYWWRQSTRRGSTVYAQAHSTHSKADRKRITMHGLIMGPPQGMVVDHINGDGLDNRRSNLRIVTVQQNSFNQPSRKGSSKFKGVCFDKETSKWRATIRVGGKKVSLGRHESEEDAAHAYNTAAKEHFGEHAWLNDLAAAPKWGGE